MSEKIFLFLTGVMMLAGCNSRTPEIRTGCIRDGIGNYIIRWETDPQMEGNVKVYASENPDEFNRLRPSGIANISDNVTTYVTSDNIARQYFMLTFNDKYTRVVSSRSLNLDSVKNFRDLGGYYTSSGDNGKMTRWGKLYRTGKLNNVSEWDSLRLDNLGIKTIIDLRTEEEIEMSPINYRNAKIINIPVPNGNMPDIMERLKAGRARKGDGILFMQDLYLQYLTENQKQFGKAMEVLLNEDNYPIVFNCSFGKDRVGFLSAIVLAALGIPEDVIMRDYMLSNEYVDIKSVESFARQLTPDGQETVTVMMLSNEAFLDLAFRKIRKDYGSVDKYLSKELNFSEKNQAQLKDILLF